MTKKQEIIIKEQRLRKLLDNLGLEGILLKSQVNFNWFTAGGLNVVTIADTQGVSSILITRSKRTVISDVIEFPRMSEDEGLQDLDFDFITYDWYEQDGESKKLKSIIDLEKIGCDLPGFGYRLIAKEIQEQRYQLLQPEIDRYLWLGNAASIALESTLTRVEKGMTECQVIGMLSERLWKDRIDSVCWQAAADERAYKYRHPIPTEKKLDTYLLVNCNARKWGLVTTVTRSVYLGKVPEALRQQYLTTTEIECEMIHMSTPGRPVKEILSHTAGLYEKNGFTDEWKKHHQGGAQGYKNRDYLVVPSSQEKVLENQCFCWNPSIAGTKSEDAFIATASGPLPITKRIFFPSLTIQIQDTTFDRPGILELS